MPKLPRRNNSARQALRPACDTVEVRRRERLAEAGDAWWPRGRPARGFSAGIVAVFGAIVLLGLAMDAGVGGALAFGEPALAAQQHESRRAPSAQHAAHVVMIRHVHHALSGGRRFARAHLSANPTPLPPTTAPVPIATPLPPATGAPSSPLSVAQGWSLTADGEYQTVVTFALPADASPINADVEFSSTAGDVLPLDAHASNAPGAIVTVTDGSSPVAVTALARTPSLPPVSIQLPPPNGAAAFGAMAQSIGPRLIDVGWTRLPDAAQVTEYKVFRRAAGAARGVLVGSVSPAGRTWRDDSVAPTTSYRYTVVAEAEAGSRAASTFFVSTPPIMQPTSIDAISGKGMFLYFSPNAAEQNSYVEYDPDAVIARAKAAGISHIEVRLARGTFLEAQNGDVQSWLDQLIDKAAAARIDLLAWQVPRRATSADAATAVSIAKYRTGAGNGFAGLALDLEDGDNYMGSGAAAKQAMAQQIEMVRDAVGPDFLIVATVMSPKLTHWTNQRYPYDRIAPYASVMQPMEYWHHFFLSSGHDYTQDEVTSACADSVALTQSLAGRQVPINVAGQSDDLGTTGVPGPDEIVWCLTGAKSAGAIGETFFDWRGTGDPVWSAIASFDW
jgi:hypothetical protein